MVRLSCDLSERLQKVLTPIASSGFAWTRAILGAQADEVHVCGDISLLHVVSRLCAITGDHLEVARYERLQPLRFDRHLPSLSSVQR